MIAFLQLILGLTLSTAVFANTSQNVASRFDELKKNPEALSRFIRAMPKGGDLHYHLPGSSYAENLLSYAKTKNTCLDAALGFHTCPAKYNIKNIEKNSGLWNRIIDAWSLRNFKGTTKEKHDHFFSAFDKYWPILQAHQAEVLAEVKSRAAHQHIFYLEPMTMPDFLDSSHLGKTLPNKGNYEEKRQWLLMHGLKPLLANARALTTHLEQRADSELQCEKRPRNPACDVTVRYIYHALREQPLNSVFAQLVFGFELAKEDPRYVGVNLVMPEEGRIALSDYNEHMHMIGFLKTKYPNVKVSLHAGELTPAIAKPSDLGFHINNAVHIAHADRIGHGIDIAHENQHENLLKYMAENKIAVEINLTSNEELLGIHNNHPFHIYQKTKVPMVLSTDDEALLRTDLGTEFLHAVQRFNLSYAELKELNRNSLTYSFLPGKSIWGSVCVHDKSVDEQPSSQCAAFLKTSEKASVQWRLEKALTRMETAAL